VVMTVWCEADLVLPNVTKICARGAKPIGVFGLVYQLLPPSGSGSTPAVRDLYQSLPPRRRRRGTGHGSGCRPNQPSVSHSERAAGCHMGSMVKGTQRGTAWRTERAIRYSQTARSVSERKKKKI